MQILYLSKFVRQYKKLAQNVQNLAEKKGRIFRLNPFDSRLKSHKLSGEFEGFYAFSINFEYRIIFDFDTTKDVARFYQIGTHEIYD
jgi:addiction module RelE/StbE family toxin